MAEIRRGCGGGGSGGAMRGVVVVVAERRRGGGGGTEHFGERSDGGRAASYNLAEEKPRPILP